MTIANVPASPARHHKWTPSPPAWGGSPTIGLHIIRWGAHSGLVRGNVDTSELEGGNRQHGAKKPTGNRPNGRVR